MSGPSLTVHPEHVSFGFLITVLVAPPPAESGWGVGFDGPAAQHMLALFLLEEIQDTSRPTLSPLPRLMQRLQQQLGTAGATLANVLVAGLQTLQTPDDMVSLAARFSSFLAPPGTTPSAATDVSSIAYISTSSPLGLFLRRIRLGLISMSLQGLAALAAAVQQQVQDAVTQLRQQQAVPQQDKDPAAEAAAASQSPSTGALKDPAVLEAYLNTLLAAVKSLGPCLPAAAVEAAAAPLSELPDSTAKLQYLNLAVSLAHQDMNAALSALHQYFDSSGSSSGPTGLPGLSGSRGKGQHQAALHNLAALQVSLGHPQEALAALQELLRLGQQQGDEWSLLHGLASLCRVMGVSEGLQGRRPGTSGASTAGSGSSWAGWGLLDLRRTEQQLQLQSLLQRCLDSARDMRVPHIAAYAAVALCRFRLTHASSSSSLEAVTAVPGLSSDSGAAAATAAAAAAGTSLSVQRMLLDVATLEHQAAVAAAAPGLPAVAAAAGAAGLAQGQAPVAGLAGRASELYNATEAFGMAMSTPGRVATAAAAGGRATTATGSGWRSSSAAVTQALATGNIVAAAALQLQGASVLAGLKCLMVLNGPGGAGIHDASVAAALPAAAAAAAAGYASARADQSSADGPEAAAAATRSAAAAAAGCEVSTAALTGSNVSCEDIAAAWVQLVQVALEMQGAAGARHVLDMAQGHFPGEPPQQLAVAGELVRLRSALQDGHFTDARLACEQLQSLAPAAPQLGLELQLVAAEAHIQLLQASGCFAEAHAAAASMFATAAGAGMQPQAVMALVLMAEACLAAGDAAGGLPCALSALLHCQVLQLDGLLPEAVLQVGTAWQALAPDGAQFVLKLLQQVLPLAHAQGKLKLRGQLEEAIAKLRLALAPAGIHSAAAAPAQQGEGGGVTAAAAAAEGGAGSGSAGGSGGSVLQESSTDVQDVCQRLSAAAVMLQQAGEMKAAAGCWLLLAHMFNAAGLERDRNDAAAQWQLCRHRASAAST